ncbi:hypothetical protein FNV43_RR02678 [Rhamnella rubrinervis]|uniref:Uncharacterized protein n=1 Tax=Rhamnella rubrinervis TaxID=2594499 RepID=A0A8K0MU36_9ROSA|nr:hypothetical protein FNV43_RR02678 [Rhamnella rubrinervis]
MKKEDRELLEPSLKRNLISHGSLDETGFYYKVVLESRGAVNHLECDTPFGHINSSYSYIILARFPQDLTPLAQRFSSPSLETKQDDLSWLTKGAPEGTNYLLDFEVEGEEVGVVASGSTPTGVKVDDRVITATSTTNSSEPENYELKDLLSNIS